MKNALIAFNLTNRGAQDRQAATALGRELYRLNYDAVEARYPDTRDNGNHPGPVPPVDVASYSFPVDVTAWRDRRSMVTAYKAAQCLRYQCLEGDVPERELFADLEAVLMDLGAAIVRTLPEYEEAPWG